MAASSVEPRAVCRALLALVLALAAFPACGLNKAGKTQVASVNAGLTQSLEQSAPELRPLITEFYAEAAKRGVQLPEWKSYGSFIEDEEIGDTPETKDFAARCYQFNDQHFEFRRYSWNRMDPLMHRWVVFHELGHCILGRDHQDAPVAVNFEAPCHLSPVVYSASMPSSIMASVNTIDIAYFMKGWKPYVDELFTRNAIDLSPLAVAPERIAKLEADWRKILEPVLERFDSEAARLGAKLPRTRLDQGKGAFVTSISQDGTEVDVGANFLAQRLCYSDPGPELRESVIEPIVFAEVARTMLPREAHGNLPGKWDGIGPGATDAKFFGDYAAHREELLKELFTSSSLNPTLLNGRVP